MSEANQDYLTLASLPQENIESIGRAIRERKISCVDVLNRCLENVERWESKVHAWVVLDVEGSLAQAKALDDDLAEGRDRGLLHGIPVGVKDLFDVKGLPTGCGAKRWVNRIAETDAEAVARLRAAGAVIMGKTITTAYACLDPPITCNPWNLERTPGGSSSGSAAAVACGMCFGAIGSQTGGSITRPASFCGVAGMKPSKFAVLNLGHGLLPFAPSLDHVGPIAKTVAGLRSLFQVLSEPVKNSFSDDPERALEDSNAQVLRLPRIDESDSRLHPNAVRFVRFRGFFDRRLEPPVKLVIDNALQALELGGAEIIELDDPVDFEQILENHGIVIAAEGARVHSDWLDEFPEDYPPRIRELILKGRKIPAIEYLKARDAMRNGRLEITKALDNARARALITPASVSTAPDRETTGDPAFNAPWSFTQLPTVSFPVGIAADSLPVALQMVGRSMTDPQLLSDAEWCEQVIQA